MQKYQAKQVVLIVVFKAKAIHFKQQNESFQHCYESYCDYLLQYGRRASCIWTAKFKGFQEVEFHSINGALSYLRHFSETKKSLKMMKHAFYFTLKALLVLIIFNFLSWIFGHVKKRLYFGKVRLISKFMTSKPG